MKQFHTLIIFALVTLSLSTAALATEQAGPMVVDGDDFGGSYFTSAVPAALDDRDDFISPEMLNNIEPAAGGDTGFTLPEDAADEATRMMENSTTYNEHGVLEAPEDALIPGME